MRITAGSSSPTVTGRKEFERAAGPIGNLGARIGGKGIVEITLIGARRMARLNSVYKGRRGVAEILTFPYDDAPSPEGEGTAGEILICWKRLAASAGSLGVSNRSYLLRLVAHGLSHLEGYSHQSDDEAARMEKREKRLLEGVVPRRDLARLFG